MTEASFSRAVTGNVVSYYFFLVSWEGQRQENPHLCLTEREQILM
jgi:hypothetical protein